MSPAASARTGGGGWTDEEDQILRDSVVEQSASMGERYDWHAIAARLPGRSNKACRKRWTCCVAPQIKKGPWDAVEIDLLHEAVGYYGMKWPSVARHVGTRQPDQCARRWHEAAKPDINRGRWSLFEDEMLQNAVRAHGRKWTEIVERYFSDRTPIAAKNRYNQILKVRTSNSVETPESAPGSAMSSEAGFW